MSKTERALTSDEVDVSEELDELDEPVAAAANGNGAASDVDEVDDDQETTAEIWAQVDEALDEYVAEEQADDTDVVDAADTDVVDVADLDAVDDVDVDDVADVEVADEALDGYVAEEQAGDPDVADAADTDVADAVDVHDLEVAGVDGVADVDEVDDVEVADETVEESDETAAHARADSPDDEIADEIEAADGVDGDADGAGAVDTIDAESDDAESDDEPYEIPEIVPATPEPAVALVEGRDGDTETEETEQSEEVSEDILEELRRADIDGPIVEMAPQDDTTSQRRRPKRAPDYDPAPVPIPADVPRVLGRKPRVRKVTRVVRHVDPWSVFKIAIVANLVLYVIVMTAGVLLWNVAHATGTVDNVERFFESFGWTSFEFNGGEIYHAAWIAGLFVVVGLTGLAVLLATLFNLITDLVGGVRLTVLEEEVVETRTSPMRRFVVRRAEPDVPVTLHDESGAMVREAVVDDSGAIKRPTR